MSAKMNAIWYLSDVHACGVVRADVPARAINQGGLVRIGCQQNLALSDFFGIDLMVFQRACTEGHLNRLLTARDRGIATIYDIDDDLFNVPPHVPDAYNYFSQGETKDLIGKFLRAADLVTASTSFLAEYIRQFTDRPIYVVPNCIDNGHVQFSLKNRKPRDPDRVVIGWHGSKTHCDDAALVVDALVWALETYPHVDVRLHGSFEPADFQDRLKPFGPRVVFSGWADPMDLYAVLAGFDIGLAPLKPSNFNRCKSEIKWMEYAAVGVPCIASDEVPYQDLTHGTDVLLTDGKPESWKAHLGWLVEDANRRALIGQAARIKLLSEFDNRVVAPRWIDVFKAAVKERLSTNLRK